MPESPADRPSATASGWIAERTAAFDTSGIRRVFELARHLEDPINLSIGQPDFDVPEAIQTATIEAIRGGKNAYAPTEGIAPLRQTIANEVASTYGHDDRDVFVCSGTSGGLVLAMWSMIDPGDEVIFMDPYFLMYPPLIRMCGGVPMPIDSYPDFRLNPAKIEAAITSRTKMILVNSPANPSGVVATRADLRAVAEIAARHGIALVSDEIYSQFIFDEPFVSPAEFNDQTIVIDGFSKSHAMTGWRVGYVHGPKDIITTMMKLQQYSFVCAPQPAQWGALRALEVDMSGHIDDYARKRDLIYDGLRDLYDVARPAGAFYLFPRVPDSFVEQHGGGANRFVDRAIENELLIIPGNVFSQADTHFRVSFAADDETLRRGIEVLRAMA